MIYHDSKLPVSSRRGLPDEGLDQDFPPIQRGPCKEPPIAPASNVTPNKGPFAFVKEPLQRFPTQGPPTPPIGGSKKQVTRGDSHKLQSGSHPPSKSATPNKKPLVFVKEPLQRFPTQGPPTPPIGGSKKQVTRGDGTRFLSGSLVRLEAEHHQNISAASVITTTTSTPSKVSHLDSPDGALHSSGVVVDDGGRHLLREHSNNSSSSKDVRSGIIQEEEKRKWPQSARMPDSAAVPLPPPQSPGASKSPACRRRKELHKSLGLATSSGDERLCQWIEDGTYTSDDRDMKTKAAAHLSKERLLNTGIQHLEDPRVNCLQKSENVESKGDQNQQREELSAKPCAIRIGDNVEQEDEAGLEEVRVTCRLGNHERQLGREGRDYLHPSPVDATGASRSSLSASRSSNDAITLAPVTPVNNEDDYKLQLWPQKWWVRALGIALLLLAITIGVAVGVSRSRKTSKIGNIAAPTSAPSTSFPNSPMTMTPTSLPTLSVNPTISGNMWSQLGVGLAGGEFAWVGIDVSLSGDGSTVAVSSLARTGGEIASISVATVGPGEWTRVGPDLVLEARAAIHLSQDGKRLLVGIPSGNEGQLGRAAVYSWDGNSYSQIGQNFTQVSSASDASFAKAVSISDSGSRIAMADPTMASVYIYDLVADLWVIIGVITGHDAHAIALSGDGSTIAISSTAASSESFSSDIFVYSFVDGERWAMVGQALNAADVPDDERASPLALSQNGSVLVAGASRFGKQTQGMVQVFHLDTASEPVRWKPKGSQIIGAELDSLGWSVDVSADGSVIAVGLPRFDSIIPGSTHVYELFNGKWRQVGDAIESEEFEIPGLSGFAISVDDAGRLLAVGAPQAPNDRGEPNAGLALVFELL